MTDMNILDLFLKASLLVKLIMLILIGFLSLPGLSLFRERVSLTRPRVKLKRSRTNSGPGSSSRLYRRAGASR
nr:colicin uptake protein TolQ [Klebsiella pneumoniae]